MSMEHEIAELVAEGLTEQQACALLLELTAYALSWDYGALCAVDDVRSYASSWDHSAALAGNPAAMDADDLPF